MKFTTVIEAIDPHTKELTPYAGPVIEALSYDHAQLICDKNFPYCLVDMESTGEQTHISNFEMN